MRKWQLATDDASAALDALNSRLTSAISVLNSTVMG